MKRLIPFIFAAALALAQGSAAVDLKTALHKEQVQGDLKGAIEAYRKIVAKHGKDRGVTAQAMLHMAQCHEKLGQSDAKRLYEELAKNYSDQTAIVAQARGRLIAMGAASAKTVSTRQLMINPEQACYPWNVSQDGRLLGAVEYLTGNMAVVDTATGECRALTNWGKRDNKNGFVDQGAISRDGKWLASWHYGAANDGEIRVVGTDGKGERTAYVKRQPEWGIPTDWSPDGNSILVLFEHGKQGSNQSGTAEIATVAVNGGALKILTSYDYATRHRPKILYSPDGKFIARDHPVKPGSGDTDIVIMPAAGGEEVRIAVNPGADKLVGWSAAGSLIFTSDRTGRLGLYQVKISNGKQAGEPEELRASLPDIVPVGIAANGTLYYSETVARNDAMAAQIDLANAKMASSPQLLFPRFPKSTGFATWSPDGRFVAARRWTGDPSRTTFVIQPVSGGEPRELTAPFRMLQRTRLHWSPDGKYLHTSGSTASGPGVFRIDVNTGALKTLSTSLDNIDWTADGRHLFLRGGPNGSHILRTDTQTGETKTIFQHTAITGSFAGSLDGKQLSFVGSGYSQENPSPFLILDIERGVARQVDSAWFAHESPKFVWTPDGQNVVAIRNPARGQNRPAFGIIPVNGDPVRQLDLRFPEKLGITGLAIHPDGKTLTWTQMAEEQLWWAMENIIPAK